jgi:predicted SAM-dependent methyltransferase
MKPAAFLEKCAIALIPRRIKRCIMRKVLQYVDRETPRNYACPVCGGSVAEFKPLYQYFFDFYEQYGFKYPLYYWETFNYIKNRCPHCDANDRDRLYALFIKKQFGKIDTTQKYTFIDFAPSPALSKMIAGFDFIQYRSADLMMEHVDDRVDITDMGIYSDHTFDFLLCSHVLEHVPDDLQAMKELYRILKPGGWGIIMAPIMTTLEKSHEDPSIISEADRWKYYGQHDHVRVYARADFVGRLAAAGFTVRLYDKNYFSAEAFEQNGIHKNSVLYVVEK